jgi:hypothetical protein
MSWRHRESVPAGGDCYFAWGCFRYFASTAGARAELKARKLEPSEDPSLAPDFGLDSLPQLVHYTFQLTPMIRGG